MLHHAQIIYTDFLQHVVIDHVFSDAERSYAGDALDHLRRSEIGEKKRVDTRAPFLARISGKGGWSENAGQREKFAAYVNVSLLDHLTSVVRGALQFAELDIVAGRNPAPSDLTRRLAMVATVAFLHDADKMLQLPRHVSLDTDMIAGLMNRFGLHDFLARHNASLPADCLLALIDSIEITRAGRMAAIPKEYWQDRMYVRLADRCDSIFLRFQSATEEEAKGFSGVREEIERFAELHTKVIRTGGTADDPDGHGWRVIELRDPHIPFLLDAFQAALSTGCNDQHGFPPLIEIHHDGRFLMILPQRHSDAVITRAFGRVTARLGAAIRVETNIRGKVDLLDARGTLDELRESISDMKRPDREDVLRSSIDVLRTHGQAIDDFLAPVGFMPQTTDLNTVRRLIPLWSGTAAYDESRAAIHTDAVLVNVVLSCDDPPARMKIPDKSCRERELRALLTEQGIITEVPAWLEASPPDTRRALLAGFAAAAASTRPDLHEALMTLVSLWLEGTIGRLGLVEKIEATGSRMRAAVEGHIRMLLEGRLVDADEAHDGRCHFTNMPVPRTARIDSKTGLYGVNISAFSGREGRPERLRAPVAETLVSPIAEAEHRLRRLDYEMNGRSAALRDVPVRVTSPTTSGLFGALAYTRDGDVNEYALSDVLRARIEPDRLTYNDAEATRHRVRIARFEEMPTRLGTSGAKPGQIAFVAMAFAVARRTGRPVHVFRGLPHPRPEFVAFDTLPQPIERLLGGTGFRLEELPRCLALLRGIEAVIDATGFGEGLALRLGDPDTRFSAACDTLARVERRGADPRLTGIKIFVTNILGDNSTVRTVTDRAFVDFGEAMAFAQRIPIRSDGGSVAELGLRTALDTTEVLERMGQTDDDSLVAGIAGEITQILSRRGLGARRELRDGRLLADAVEVAARVFVERVWHGAFGGAVPSSRNRRVALATYRYAFHTQAGRLRTKAGLDVQDAGVTTDTPEHA